MAAQLSLVILFAGLNKCIDDEALRQKAHCGITKADEERIPRRGYARDAAAEGHERSCPPATNLLITAQGPVDWSIASQNEPECDRVF